MNTRFSEEPAGDLHLERIRGQALGQIDGFLEDNSGRRAGICKLNGHEHGYHGLVIEHVQDILVRVCDRVVRDEPSYGPTLIPLLSQTHEVLNNRFETVTRDRLARAVREASDVDSLWVVNGNWEVRAGIKRTVI